MPIWDEYECDEQMDIFQFLGEETKIHITKPIKLIEMFSGYGSQALALKYLGIPFEHHFVCEIDKFACESYRALHGVDVSPTDICNVTGEMLNITDTDKYMYLMTYSFPCTDLSCSGNMKGMSKGSGTRSGLLWEIERILTELNMKGGGQLPQLLMLENVTNIHSVGIIHDFKMWIRFLEELGYISFWQDLNAKDFGIPQNRERTIMFSFLKTEFGSNIVYQFPKPFPLKTTLEDLLEDDVEEKYYLKGEAIEKMIDELKEREGI